MVYCVKCGVNNSDDAKVCAQCGTSLYPARKQKLRKRSEGECFGAREECFGIPRGGTIVSLAIGIIILLVGGIWLLQQAQLIPETVEIWPFILMILGILILVGALYGLRRRY